MISRNRIFNGVVNASLVSTSFMQAGRVHVDATTGGTVVLFPTSFASTPYIVASDTDSAAGAIAITTLSAGSFTIVSASAGTCDWIAMLAPTG